MDGYNEPSVPLLRTAHDILATAVITPDKAYEVCEVCSLSWPGFEKLISAIKSAIEGERERLAHQLKPGDEAWNNWYLDFIHYEVRRFFPQVPLGDEEWWFREGHRVANVLYPFVLGAYLNADWDESFPDLDPRLYLRRRFEEEKTGIVGSIADEAYWRIVELPRHSLLAGPQPMHPNEGAVGYSQTPAIVKAHDIANPLDTLKRTPYRRFTADGSPEWADGFTEENNAAGNSGGISTLRVGSRHPRAEAARNTTPFPDQSVAPPPSQRRHFESQLLKSEAAATNQNSGESRGKRYVPPVMRLATTVIDPNSALLPETVFVPATGLLTFQTLIKTAYDNHGIHPAHEIAKVRVVTPGYRIKIVLGQGNEESEWEMAMKHMLENGVGEVVIHLVSE